jgi:uncharacterized protein
MREVTMALNEDLKQILCCPKCKGDLEFKEEEQKILCNSCRLIYQIRDDIPVMLIDEAEKF